MKRSYTRGRFAKSLAMLGMLALSISAQDNEHSVAAGSYKVPRTPDGQPDIQGMWTNITITPLERPPDLTGKSFFTKAEAAEYEKKALRAADNDRTDVTDAALYRH